MKLANALNLISSIWWVIKNRPTRYLFKKTGLDINYIVAQASLHNCYWRFEWPMGHKFVLKSKMIGLGWRMYYTEKKSQNL